VVLIDANLRAPSLHTALGVRNPPGLGDILADGGALEPLLRPTAFDGLSVITAGARAANPADLLIDDGLARLVKALQDRFDHVIVDGPAMMQLADAPLVASAVDGVVYVVACGAAPAGRIRAALGRLDKASMVGGVLTKGPSGRAPRPFAAS
jgi:succinoglycan biosynthesis transport protein ExoP